MLLLVGLRKFFFLKVKKSIMLLLANAAGVIFLARLAFVVFRQTHNASVVFFDEICPGPWFELHELGAVFQEMMWFTSHCTLSSGVEGIHVVFFIAHIREFTRIIISFAIFF